MVRVEHVLESWKAIRADTTAAVEEFPAPEFDFRPAPDAMSFREMAQHILDAGDGLTGLLLSGDDDFATDFRIKLKAHMREIASDASPAELAAALRESVERRTTELGARQAEFFAHLITRMDGQKVTRLEMLQFVKEHELTHRAQLFLCLRLKGIVPPPTRRRQAKQAAR
jgi:uncharacterized damage-inducible protein DinB